MSKLEQFISIFVGFLIFEVVYIRLGMIVESPISKYTLVLSLIMYSAALTFFYSITSIIKEKLTRYIPIISFLLIFIILGGVSFLLGKTYDTSWDGQGYHQSAVIAMASGWNPVRTPEISFSERLPSQIFAEGYPSALWEIEASIYSLTNNINSAKVVNIAIAVIAFSIVYSLLRNLRIGKLFSIFISLLIVLQPVYIVQMLTFMEDGFGYELFVIAGASLMLSILYPKAYWALFVFIMTELLLVTTKYSHLPFALALGLIFGYIFVNQLLNREYHFDNYMKIALVGIFIISAIFAYVPYGRNQLFHKALFYPTNIPALMGSVTYNNVPNNLQKHSKLELLFYGIFSKSQSMESGDPRNKKNVAELKMPFTFTSSEVVSGVQMYNNRVGGGGPLFSGIVLISVGLIVISYLIAKNRKERYAVYSSLFICGIIIILALAAPTPNLLRYVSQLQLIPFVLTIPVFVIFKKIFIRGLCVVIMLLMAVNLGIFFSFYIPKTIAETTAENKQFAGMRNSGDHYEVKAQQFYSAYVILKEQQIPFSIVKDFDCRKVQSLYASSTTTQYCAKRK